MLGDQNISYDLNDWADFGSYIGGTTNTLISILSLITLAYLTYIVGKQSSIENKNVNLLMRKLDAFDALAAYMPRFNVFAHEFSRNSRILAKEIDSSIKSAEYFNAKSNIIKNVSFMFELNYFLYSYKTRYSHLFSYDFDSKEHLDLIGVSEKVNQYFNDFACNIEIDGQIKSGVNLNEIEEFALRLKKLIISLKSELK